MGTVRPQRLDLAAVRVSVERALRAISLALGVGLLAADVARADDVRLWCTDEERTAYRNVAASTFNPIEFVVPQYPQERHLQAEGYVELAVALEADGRVRHLCILGSEPSGTFEKTTFDAVRRWRYDPADAAKLGPGRRMKVRVDFRLQR